MYNVLFAAHVLVAVFAVGPLAAGAASAARGIRAGDASALASSARTTRIYAYVSVLVIVLGFGLVGAGKGEDKHKLSEPWIGVSVVLWLVAVALALFVLVPALDRAAALVAGPTADSAAPLTGRVAACGGVIALLFAVIVVLMVYQPGA